MIIHKGICSLRPLITHHFNPLTTQQLNITHFRFSACCTSFRNNKVSPYQYIKFLRESCIETRFCCVVCGKANDLFHALSVVNYASNCNNTQTESWGYYKDKQNFPGLNECKPSVVFVYTWPNTFLIVSANLPACNWSLEYIT